MKLAPWRQKSQADLSGAGSSPLAHLRSEMDHLFERFFDGGWNGADAETDILHMAPAVDITETDTQIRVKTELPGVEPADVDVSIANDTLTISGRKEEKEEEKGESFFRSERRFGSFMRRVQLPCHVNAEKVDARFKNGVLTVSIEKDQASKPRRIKIAAAT